MVNQTESNAYAPPIEIMDFVKVLLSDEVRGNKVRAEELSGVDRGKFYYHWKKSEFRKWYLEQCNQYLTSNEATVATSECSGHLCIHMLYHKRVSCSGIV